MAEKKPILTGGNGGKIASMSPDKPITDSDRAQDIARRYRCEFVDLNDFQLQHELFKKIPVDLMSRYNFIPLEETRDGKLAIAIADPSQLMMIDEISLLLGKRIVTKVSTLKQISDILKKTEQSQRVLEEASEGFALDVIREDEQTGEETISIDKLTQAGDHSPIIRLVDTTIFTALQRRATSCARSRSVTGLPVGLIGAPFPPPTKRDFLSAVAITYSLTGALSHSRC